ncbi:hypothetical protein CLV30_109190 [Haloactinopolyspora alba]|uniref:Tail terminator n=1 Tax=Haloactinopolyspora alba TaxID=648780 RepID=A0A2P8E084_9ACTN|nr:hypothetical protein [Haloactinopolyspora alba]PSL02882.1 hypothetical protein CLV30_109190 [Haloactinopolyspora alba]
MNLNSVMDEIGARLDTITGLKVWPYPADSITPPAAIVAYPDTLTFDETYGRGMDRLTLPVVLVVGRQSDRASRDHLAAYANGFGARSIKQTVEAGTYTAMDTVRVMSAEFDVIRISNVDYVAATFDLDITGQGSS